MISTTRPEGQEIIIISEMGFPIRTSMGQRSLAPHHSLSQRVMSFIASYRQDIHQMPFCA